MASPENKPSLQPGDRILIRPKGSFREWYSRRVNRLIWRSGSRIVPHWILEVWFRRKPGVITVSLVSPDKHDIRITGRRGKKGERKSVTAG